jgi:uncharacterized protein YjiS (DUF1127 family)
MLCIAFKSFIYAKIRPIFTGPPEGAADMFSLRSILGGVREAALSCIGSPHSRARQLAALRDLDAHLLNDIGLTREEVRRGASLRAVMPNETPRLVPIGRFSWKR